MESFKRGARRFGRVAAATAAVFLAGLALALVADLGRAARAVADTPPVAGLECRDPVEVAQALRSGGWGIVGQGVGDDGKPWRLAMTPSGDRWMLLVVKDGKICGASGGTWKFQRWAPVALGVDL